MSCLRSASTLPSLYLGLSPPQRKLVIALFAVAITVLYLYNLDGTGVLGPDEPRYSAIGRAMASDGDWITPHLWGEPWFEKPPLVYWTTAVATLLGLNPDLAGRLPVAILSLAFLALWFVLLKAEFGERAAATSALLLATSAAWLTYSELCLTDVPMAAFFSLAVAFALTVLRSGPSARNLAALGACLGAAVLAKGLLPLVLAVPLLWFLRRHWRRWWIALATFTLLAGPWYALVLVRNGHAFLDVFFFRQQLSRLYSQSLQHVQPLYFYVPVLLACLFPWTPLIASFRSRLWDDTRVRLLTSVFLFGLIFLSFSLNKLPGYLVPLLPSVFALIGVSVAESSRAFENRIWLVGCALLIALIPFVGRWIPVLLTSKIGSLRQLLLASLPITVGMMIFFALPLIVAIALSPRLAAPALTLCCLLAGLYVKSVIYPTIDREASPRVTWHEISLRADDVCDAGLHRAWRYGLAFYRGSLLPLCSDSPKPIQLRQIGTSRPEIVIDAHQIGSIHHDRSLRPE
jgi:4-amino-4-deoxy-L-arabinose transferase-like glycosyltransferase